MAVAVSVSLFAASPASRESMRRGEELFSAGKWNEARRELAGVVDDPALTAAERQRVECYIALCSIEQGDEQATLRFAHDVTVIPFAAILGIKCANTVSDDWANIGYKWRINEVTPMGANIQMIFYRSKRSDEILVKIMHNEREQILDSSVATPLESVYYRWEDIREYLQSKIR